MPNPWMTSDDLLTSVKRKISFPTSQSTFTDADILAFANEELMISQVPSILSFHEEYFVTKEIQTLKGYQDHYLIPTRAIGMKLRGVFWCDQTYGPDATATQPGGNLFEMTRVSSEDKAFFQANVGATRAIHKYYIEGNYVVLTPSPDSSPQGSLVLYYFLRPNQLTTTDQAATISTFGKTITVNAASITAGQTITIVDQNGTTTTLTAVSGAPSTNQFQIAGTDAATATNLANAISATGIATATPTTNVVTAAYSYRAITFTSDSTGMVVSSLLACNCNQVPSTFTNGSVIDFLQTKPGHVLRGMSVTIPSTGISGTTINFTDTDVPSTMVVGDYICLENQCIIPQIPPDLHNGLAERTASRILAALGDQAGLQASGQKIAEIEKSQGMLLDNRTEGEPRKVLARHSLLRFGKMGTSRRL
jgi:hypothetical protein